MEVLAVIFFVLPFIGAFFVMGFRGALRTITTVKMALLPALCSILFYCIMDVPVVVLDAGEFLSHTILAADFLLLGFFLYQGVKKSNKTILILSSIQLVLLMTFTMLGLHENTPALRIDHLSAMMFLLVNIVGGIIVLYAIGYMKDEDTSEWRKSYFLALLVAFLGVMNLAVSSDNLEWFFFFFELTTLFSYLLIGFRDDEISKQNALNALKLNLYAGVALACMIVVATYALGTVSINTLLSSSHSPAVMLLIILFCFAGFVKGAQPPFSSWLLGAMVAPTPVSAILHSATMVKIAPFMLLKASPFLHETFFAKSMSLLLFGSFLISGYLALKEDNFKKVLAYSTISLLGLMMGLALFGSPLAVTAAMVLMIFHGISKALLFLQAGILEKAFHIKSVEDFGGLWNKSRSTVFLILFGFLSIIVPPFGAFLAKWLAIESLASSSGAYLALSSVAVALGGIVLTILYFKVSFKLSIQTGSPEPSTKLRFSYNASSYLLASMLFVFAIYIAPIVAGFFAPIAQFITSKPSGIRADGLSLVLVGGSFYFWQIMLTTLLIVSFSVISFYSSKTMSDTAHAYYCAEKKEVKLSAFYFASDKIGQKLSVVFGYLLGFIMLFGVFL